MRNTFSKTVPIAGKSGRPFSGYTCLVPVLRHYSNEINKFSIYEV